MSTIETAIETTFKSPGFIRVHENHLRLFADQFEIEIRGTKHHFQFSEIESMSNATTSHYFNGVPQGLSHTVQLWKKGDLKKKPHNFFFEQFPEKIDRPRFMGMTVPFSPTHANPQADPVYEEFIDRLAYQLSLQMMEHVERCGTTIWVPKVALTSSGIVYSPNARKSYSCLFNEIVSTEFVDGLWRMTSTSASLGDLQIDTASVNFSPGLKLFSALYNLTSSHFSV